MWRSLSIKTTDQAATQIIFVKVRVGEVGFIAPFKK